MAENCNEPTNSARRVFLARLMLGAGALGGALLAMPALGFILAPLFRRTPEEWRALGPVDRFPLRATVNVTFEDPSPLPWAGVTAKSGAWLRRVEGESFIGFSVNCSHLGCPVRWLSSAELFMCPCHGGVYNADGSVAAGPPPRPLTRYDVRVRDGQVELRTRPVPIG